MCTHWFGGEGVNNIACIAISSLTRITTNLFSRGLRPFAWAVVLKNADNESIILLGELFHQFSLLKTHNT